MFAVGKSINRIVDTGHLLQGKRTSMARRPFSMKVYRAKLMIYGHLMALMMKMQQTKEASPERLFPRKPPPPPPPPQQQQQGNCHPNAKQRLASTEQDELETKQSLHDLTTDYRMSPSPAGNKSTLATGAGHRGS